MPRFRFAFLLAALIAASSVLSSCGDSERSFPVRTYTLGERIALGHLVYVVFETQWLTQIGAGVDARVPQHRFFLVRLSTVNSLGSDVILPNLVLEDDNGNTYPELSSGEGVPQYIGYLRSVKPAQSAQGNALFDAPPRHYKMKIMDETGDRIAYVDIPLNFVSETPDVPEMGSKDQKK
jgi:hypothetical protein